MGVLLLGCVSALNAFDDQLMFSRAWIIDGPRLCVEYIAHDAASNAEQSHYTRTVCFPLHDDGTPKCAKDLHDRGLQFVRSGDFNGWELIYLWTWETLWACMDGE